ncbi:MAG: diguanylate cyclase domain-containing protein [Comamonas sp.]
MSDPQELHEAPQAHAADGARMLPGPWLAKLLAALALALVLAAGLSAYVVAQYQERAFTRHLQAQQTDDIEVLARLMGSKLEQSQKVLASVAESLGPWATDPRPSVDWLVQQGLPAARYFDSIVIAMGSKVFRLHLRSSKGAEEADVDPAEREVLKRTLVQGKPLISAPIHSDTTEASMAFSMPLLDKSGEQKGALAGVLRLQSQGLLPPATESGLVVLTADGVILAHPDPTRILGQARDEPGLRQALAQWHESRPAGAPAAGQTHAFGPYLVSMAEIPSAGWLLARTIQRGEPLAPLAVERAIAWWPVAAIALAVLALAGFWTWMHTRRLRNLHGAVMRHNNYSGDELEVFESAWQQLSATELKQSADALQQRRLMDVWLEHAHERVVLLQDDQVERCGWALAQELGYEERELRSQPLARWVVDSQPLVPAWQALKLQGHCRLVVQVRRKTGEAVALQVRAFSVGPRRILCFVEDPGRHSPGGAGSLDALTQLPGYPALLEQAALLLHAADAPELQGEASCVLLYANVDNMSAINALAGRAEGDRILKYVADQLQLLWPHRGWAARVSGDKFALLLRACSTEQAMVLAQRLCEQVHHWRLRSHALRFPLTLSIGVVPVTGKHASAEALVRAGDLACYQAKRAGGDGVHCDSRPLPVLTAPK